MDPHKKQSAQRRETDLASLTGSIKRKITEILVKENKQYKFPGCKPKFKPQGITEHVKSCVAAKVWCKETKLPKQIDGFSTITIELRLV